MEERIFLITADTGVHARPATLLVNKASQFSSEVDLHYKEKSVNLKSIMGVMSLGIPQGAEIRVSTDGNDEEEAIKGIIEIIEEHLGEIKE